MNLYEHTIVARQDISPSQLKQLEEKYSKIVEKNQGDIVKLENWGQGLTELNKLFSPKLLDLANCFIRSANAISNTNAEKL